MPKKSHKRIPYGVADYGRMRRDNAYFVDKTHFIPVVENAPYYLFFIRPRRFGKSLWLSVLQHYYDVNLKDQFETLFRDTYIGNNPTDERNSYLILFLNFSTINPDSGYVQSSFEDTGRAAVENFLRRYKHFFPHEAQQNILHSENTAACLRRIFYYTKELDLKIYLLIDEYDNFANTILTTEGESAYRTLTHGGGFYRFFFNLLKGATTGDMAGLTRLFITGVSPITMDDVTSGFNIGSHISQDNQFNEMVGFTEPETREMLAYYHDVGKLQLDINESMTVMKSWYNNYRFSKNAQTDLFNSDMVLHFIQQAVVEQSIPERLIDHNVRIDYEKLRHLVTVDKQLNGNFSELHSVIETGEVNSNIALSFPLERLAERENFISLLYYFGLLTFDGEKEGAPLLRIPNRTVQEFMYGYLREGLRDADVFRINMRELSTRIRGMAYRGEWQSVFTFLTEEIQKQTAVRDFLQGEKVVQTFLLAYLNILDYFLIWSEQNLADGFADFYLEPFLARYKDINYGYLIEVEYIQRGNFSEKILQDKIDEAEAQLQRYAHDARIQELSNEVTIKNLILVYCGWELIYQAEWEANC